MRVILSLFLTCFLLGFLASIGNGQLIGQGVLSTVQGSTGNSIPEAPTLNDALTSILGPLLSGNSTEGGNSLTGNLTKLLAGLQNVSIGELLRGILNGNLSQLQILLGPIIELLESLPIVGPLIVLLSQVLRIPLTLVASIVALLLQILLVLLNITSTTSG
ncbi:uncharacterized protein LOC100742347 isoform X1 [Bombus impatiens]|uniref:Uncharacterized protein LOC100742347 isoform X1 n=1 Tax=Bombus impatiens TaxID=132113 RepID=A0A6P8LRN1_BOMIM|nr:uncharacterized protein LOC100742347 isoform X1 [Bombus impatiens]